MRNLLFAVALVIFYTLKWNTAIAQNKECQKLEVQQQEAAKKLEKNTEEKKTLDALFSILVKPPEIDKAFMADLNQDEDRIKLLEKLVAAGDKTPETATELNWLKDKTGLIKLRTGNNYNSNTFFNDSRFLDFEKIASKNKGEETEILAEIAKLDQSQKDNHCKTNEPTIPNTTWKSIWNGTYKNDGDKDGDLYLILQSGPPDGVTGKFDHKYKEGFAVYNISGCKESGYKMICDFKVTFEEGYQQLDASGSVEMLHTTDGLKSTWTETETHGARLKPGAPKTYYRGRDAMTYYYNFKKP